MNYFEDPNYIKMCEGIPTRIVGSMREKQSLVAAGFLRDSKSRKKYTRQDLKIWHYTDPITPKKQFIMWTLDQLFNLIWNGTSHPIAVYRDLTEIFKGDKYYHQFQTPNQLLLAYVMKEKFKKKWKREKWA